MINIINIFILLILGGCATIVSHSPNQQKIIQSLPSSALISNVPFISQKKDYCGPSTLAMVMNFKGKELTPDELAKISFTKNASGTYQQDMISASRIKEFVTVPIKSYADLFQEISSGNPVIVFRNLGFDWIPIWHYSVIIGYDNNKEEITMHSGANKNEVVLLSEFDKSWSRAKYWAFSLLIPGETSSNAEVIDYIKSAAAFENAHKFSSASRTYESVLKKWPRNELAYYGLGNIKFNNNDYKTAIKMYEYAVKINSKFSEAWFNLAVSYKLINNSLKYDYAAKMAIKSANGDKKSSLTIKLKSL
jgi:tetratricopeptide (TPR) repeat protein